MSPISLKSTESPDSENSPATAVSTTSSESCFFVSVFSPVTPVVKDKKRLEANHLLRLDTSRITRTPSLELQLTELEVLRELIERHQKHLTENQSSIEQIQKTTKFSYRRRRRPSTDFDRPTTNALRSHSEPRTHRRFDGRPRRTVDVYSPRTPNDDSGSAWRHKREGGISNQSLRSHVLPFQEILVSGMKPVHEFIPKDRKWKSVEDYYVCSAARDSKSNESRRQCRDIEANYGAGQEKRRLEKSVDSIEGKSCEFRVRREDESVKLSFRTTSVGSEDDETKRLEEASGDQSWEDGALTSDGQQQLPLDRSMQQRATTQSQHADNELHCTPIDNGHAQSQQHQHRFGHSSSCASSFSSSATEHSSLSSSVSSTSSGKGGNAGISSSLQFIKCTKDSNKQWYRPNMTREDAINLLKDKTEGSFVIRDSRSFAGHFALALKVSEAPRNTATSNGQTVDCIRQEATTSESHQMNENLIRHFLIESKPNGVRLKERSNEPLFPSLTAFVYQHCLIPLSLPHKLMLSSNFSDEMPFESDVFLKCKDLETISTTFVYIGSMDMELLTGQEALEKALAYLEYGSSPQTLVHFALSAEGILLTDTNRRVFFRRHFPLSSVSYCGRHSEEKRIFGFVSRRARSGDGNECHLFADYEIGFSADVIDSIKRHIESKNRQ